MKKAITLASFFTVIIMLVTSGLLTSLPKKPFKAKTGAPGEGTCSDCHSGAGTNMGPGYIKLTFSGANNQYKVGKTYTVTVNVYDSTKTRPGWETTTLDNINNNPAGTPQIIDATNTAIQTDASTGRKYPCSYVPNGQTVWTYKWKAPTTNIGSVTFYGAGNATNWNDATDGDNVYTTSMIISPYSPLRTTDEEVVSEELSSLEVFPNPVAAHDFTIGFTAGEDGTVTAGLYSLQGTLVQPLFSAEEEAGQHQETIHLYKHITNGIYVVMLQSGNITQYKKVVIGL